MNSGQIADYLEWLECQTASLQEQREAAKESGDTVSSLSLTHEQLGIMAAHKKFLLLLHNSAQLPAK